VSKFKIVTAIILLSLTLTASYTLPVARYKGTGFISRLEIPLTIGDWSGKDVKDRLNLDFDKNWNKLLDIGRSISGWGLSPLRRRGGLPHQIAAKGPHAKRPRHYKLSADG